MGVGYAPMFPQASQVFRLMRSSAYSRYLRTRAGSMESESPSRSGGVFGEERTADSKPSGGAKGFPPRFCRHRGFGLGSGLSRPRMWVCVRSMTGMKLSGFPCGQTPNRERSGFPSLLERWYSERQMCSNSGSVIWVRGLG